MIIDTSESGSNAIPSTLDGEIFLKFETDENGAILGVHSCTIEVLEQWRNLNAEQRASQGVDKYDSIIDDASPVAIATAKQRRAEIKARGAVSNDQAKPI